MPLLIEGAAATAYGRRSPTGTSLAPLLLIIGRQVKARLLSFGIAVSLDCKRKLVPAVNPDFLINSRNV